MSTLFIILSIYLLTVAISFPFLRRNCLNHSDACKPLNPVFVAIIMSFIPLFNIINGVKIAIKLWSIKRVSKKLEDAFKDHKDPKVKEEIAEIVKAMKQISNPNNKEE